MAGNEETARAGLPQRPETGLRLQHAGMGLTAAWLILLIIYASMNWSRLAELRPNEVGDALAGGFAPLAFFWLVLGFLQQGAELRNSGRALWLQGEELRNSVEQQRQLVEVSRESLVFEANRLERENERARALAQPLLEITLGGSTGTITGREQSFILANHGRACTRLEVFIGSRQDPIRIGKLDAGSPYEFRIMITPEWLGADVRVDYIDQHSESGSQAFEIWQKDGRLKIKKP
ncbi:MAG: hypothetical protein EON56_03875 [Alphaproteobacteria bacterium]|nr:MAG: hypothetical protein EON56_03875 [Alphaproteobacteria bacterium]